MLQYLVTSKTRRRLLSLLWGEVAEGSARDLAQRAGVSFASAHGELKAMQQAQLVRTRYEGGREVYVANVQHPGADVLRALVASETHRELAPRQSDHVVRGRLKALGAPLRGVEPSPIESAVQAVLDGVELARRDPVVARVLPLCVWSVRDSLDAKALHAWDARPEQKHALGFFLELTAELGGDRRLLGLAELVRDRRMTSRREFFQTGAPRRLRAGDSLPGFAIAERWGFRMNADLELFRSLFDKFVQR